MIIPETLDSEENRFSDLKSTNSINNKHIITSEDELLNFFNPVECVISQMMKRTDITEEEKNEIAYMLRSES